MPYATSGLIDPADLKIEFWPPRQPPQAASMSAADQVA